MRLSDLDLKPHQQQRDQTKTTCPICSKSRKKPNEPCLSVNLTDGVYYCFNCGTSGILDGFSGNRFASNKKRIFKKPNIAMTTKLDDIQDKQCLDYFKTRGLDKETLESWNISYGVIFQDKDEHGNVKVDSNGIPLGTKGIRFVSLEDRVPVNVKAFRPKEWNASGRRIMNQFPDGKPIPFGLDTVTSPMDSLVLTEGEIDAMSVWQSGHHTVWSVPNGSKGFTWLDLECVVEKLLTVKNIILAGDSDEEGIAMRDELVSRLSLLIGIEKILLCEWPDDCKDANDVLRLHGANTLRSCIDESQPIPIDGISEVDEFMGDYLNYYRNGMPTGLSTGISTLDPIYKIMPGMVTVTTGVPSHGKSEFIDEIVRKMNEQLGKKFAYYSPENHPQSLHMMKLAEKYIGKPFDIKKSGAMTEEEAIKAADWMQDNIFYINPRGKSYSVDEILDRAKILKYRHGIFGLIIDPWNYVRKDFGALREDQYINQELQKLSTFAKQTGMHIWLVVHPRTLRKDKDGNIQTPTMYDLSGGSKFGDNADFIFAVERYPKESFATNNHRVTIHVQKVRYRPAGQQGSVELHWEPFNGRFKESDPPVIGEDQDGNIYIEEDSDGESF